MLQGAHGSEALGKSGHLRHSAPASTIECAGLIFGLVDCYDCLAWHYCFLLSFFMDDVG